MSIDTLERSRVLDALEAGTFDCAVIGGGISGAGIACEASLRGMRVALLEGADFAAGTSSRSSKLIHGGLRYLAQGEVNLVRETALERKEIFRLAPHLAERRWMVVPARSRAGLMKVRVGITTYEKLGSVEDQDLHRNWGTAELEIEEPLIDRSTYTWACVYREYLTDDSRLVLANLRAAVAAGAVAANHARVDAITTEAGRAIGVEATCALSGRRVRVRARAVVNAAGPWVDAVRRLEDTRVAPLLHLSKGVHIVLPAERVPIHNMIVMGTADNRSIFAIRRGSVVYVGTTDTSYDGGSTLWPEITSEDVEYLLEPLPRYLRIEPVKPEECVGAWAGLRPLIAEPGKDPTEISRRDEVLTGPAGVIAIAGGKLTGYRPMTRRAVDEVVERIGDGRSQPGEMESLPGGDFDGDLDALAEELASEQSLPREDGKRLVRLYGTEAAAVLSLGPEPIAEPSPVRRGEVDWAVREEGAATLEDVLYRRTRSALYDPEARDAILEPMAERMTELLGWNAERRAAEVDGVRARLASDLGFIRGGSP